MYFSMLFFYTHVLEKFVKFWMTVWIVGSLEKWQKYVVQNLLEIGHQFVQFEYIAVN